MASLQPLVRLLLAVSFVTALSAGCGGCGEPNQEDVCADVTCEGGVCDPDTGLCTNADVCDGDDACVDGFVCRDEACVSSCTSNSSCGEGFYCDDGACAPNPCADVECDRGVCEINTGECVNASACTSATQAEACLDDHLCVDGDCIQVADFCAELACDRGICSADERACVNVDNCAGDDMNCVDGFFCADDNTCQENACADGGECARGVCDQVSGECVNPETCAAADDCVDGDVCLSGSCTPQTEACGAEGCPGNQACTYDASALTAACEEDPAGGCLNAVDCVDDRICLDGACAAPEACVADEREPNDTDAEAVAFATAANLGTIPNLSLCPGDTDVFSFDSLEDPDEEGLLLVRADIVPTDVGLGTVTIELVGPNGNVVATGTNVEAGVARTSVEVSATVDIVVGTDYLIRVSSSDATTAGVRYDLTADVVSMDVVATCSNLATLTPGTPVVGTTVGVTNTALLSSCNDDDATKPEVVYALELTEDAWVELQLTPELGYDAALSVRAACTNNESEFPQACEDSGGDGDAESLALALSAGVHYVVVESYDADETGSFVLTAKANPQICTNDDNTCIDGTTASVCNDSRTEFEDVDCPDGCDAGTGACLRPAGDVCATAVVVDPATGFEGYLALTGFANDYEAGDSCVTQDGSFSRTDGEDGVLVVDLPADKVLTVEAVSTASDDNSIYLSTDCSDVTASCLVGVDEVGYSSSNPEFVFYKNDTGATQQIYIFIDVGDIDSSIGQVRVKALVRDPVCTPGERRCVLNRESQLCNAAGTAYDQTTVCEDGCDPTSGACTVTNDLCSGATALTNGVAAQGTNLGYADDYEPAEDCGNLQYDNNYGASDAVFRVDTTAPNQTVTVTLDPVGFDGTLWASDSCDMDMLGSCLAGVDDTDSDGASEEMVFFAPTPGSYFVTVQDGDSGGSEGSFTITASWTDAPCVPGQTLGCNLAGDARQYCNEVGEIVDYTCSVAGCDATTGKCVAPTGDVCLDVIELDPAGGTYSGRLTNDGTDVLDFSSGVTDRCDFSYGDTDGDEIFHAIQVTQGDLLTVAFNDKGSGDGNVYFQSDCGSLDSCFGFKGDGDQTIEYFASQSETIFVVVDADTTLSSNAFDYDLTYSVTQPGWVCEPDTTRCVGAQTLEICAADGFSSTPVQCPTQCGISAADGSATCIDDPTLTDSCTTAPNVGAGISLRVDLEDEHTGTIDANGAACALDGSGPDAVFAVNAAAYDVIKVDAESTSTLDDLAIYIIGDCNDAAGTCLGGVDQDDDLTFSHQVTATGTYYVVIDHDSGTIYGTDVGVDISVEPGCLPTTPPSCSADGTALEFCVGGTTEQYACAGGCANAACVTPRGDACFDAIPLDRTKASVAGTWTNNTDTVDTGDDLTGNCLVNSAPDGADDIYAIDLAAGETLTAYMTSDESDADLYFLDDCQSPTTSCVAHNTNRDVETPISYHAATAQRIFVVVDRDDTSTDNSYTLYYDIASTACGVLAQCTDADTLVECNVDGTVKRTTTCANGCVAGGCQVPAFEADTCSGAVDIGSGGVWTSDWDLFADDLNFNGLCTGEEEDGPDMYFSATLTANQILNVNVQSIGFEAPQIYFLSDCTGDALSCLAGAHEDAVGQSVEDSVTLTYQAPADETIIIGIDSEFSSYDEPVQVKFDVLTPDCDPATYQQACTADGDAFTYCNARGFTREYICEGNGVCDATTGRCAEPVGDVCLDPFDATPTASATPEITGGTFAGFSDDYDLGTGNACTGSRTIGNEPVYVVDLTAGQTLTVEAVSTAATPEDIAVYLTPSCTDIDDVCLAGSDVEGATATPEKVTYTATGDESVYVMVDSFYSTASGTFDLTVTVN